MKSKNLVTQWINNITEIQIPEPFLSLLVSLIGFVLFVALYFGFKKILSVFFMPIIKKVVSYTATPIDEEIYRHKIFHSLISFFGLSLSYILLKEWINYEFILGVNIDKSFKIVFLLIFVRFLFRLLNFILHLGSDQNTYRTIAVTSFIQMMKVLVGILLLFVLFSVVFEVNVSTIITSLSAITAVFLLVFKDIILGFVSGIQIAASKTVKVGDWINLPKQGVEGTVKEINLVSAKISNFDKTITSVPTYDLISTPVINYEHMKVENRRRLKRVIYFNLKSFKFLGPQEKQDLAKIPLLKDYLERKKEQELTNIGTFRKYVEFYLKAMPKKIDATEIILVRQLLMESRGLPLELYCFVNTSEWAEFESIQSDIFDHLLTKTREFGLEPMQSLSA